MKNVRQFCAAVVLASVLTFSASAGDIQAPALAQPPPPQLSATGDIGMPGATATGEILTPGVTVLDPVTEAALNLLQGVLSLF